MSGEEYTPRGVSCSPTLGGGRRTTLADRDLGLPAGRGAGTHPWTGGDGSGQDVVVVPWYVYVLVSLHAERTYVGATNDLRRRLDQHNGTRPGGAKATRAGRPWRVGCTHGPFETQGEALRVELRLKRVRGRARLRVTAEMLAG